MTLSLAELHVRAVVNDTLIETAAEKLLGNESWLSAEIKQVLAEVTDATAKESTQETEAIGLNRYTDYLREKLRETHSPVELQESAG